MERLKFALAALLLSASIATAQTQTIDDAIKLLEQKSYGEARTILDPLANAEDVRAMSLMGQMMLNGMGVDADPAAAKAWYSKAADKGDVISQIALADILLGEQKIADAAPILAKAAESGNAEAQFRLGMIYAGRYGGEPEWPNAAKWLQKSAEQKHVEAEYNLGLLYLDGNGVDKNPVTAADWLSRAAVKGSPEAALEYGVLVMRGDGVQRDEKIGLKWLLYAAKRGHPVAQNRLARIYAAGVGVTVDPVEAATWNLLASKGGRPDPTLDDFMAKLSPEQKLDAEKRAAAFEPAAAPSQ
jgi:TPR repeat protein